MTLQRLYNIAQTGQTADPTAVDNIMAQYQPKKQEGGFWNGFKNFAGSDVGRMLIGGLGTAAAVGLSGGSGKDALRYGLMGAGSTMQSIDSRNRYRDKLMKEQQDRADKLAEAEKSRQHALTVQANTIQANKDAAELEFEREMEKINEGRFYNEQQKEKDKRIKIDAINSNPYLSDEQKAWQISQIDIPEFNNDAYYGSMLVRDPNNQDALTYFTNKAKLNSIINPTKPTSAFSQDLNTLTKDYGMPVDKALDYLGKRSIEQEIGLAGGKAEAEARGKTPYTMAIDNNKSRNDLNNNTTMAGINHKNDVAMEDLKHNYAIAEADNKLENDINFETYKRNLPPEKIIEAEHMAQSLQEAGFDVTAGDILNVAYQKDVLGNASTVANIGQTNANTAKTRAEIPFVGQTSEVKNYNFLQKNPDAVNSPVFAKSGNTTNIYAGQNQDEFGKQLAKNQANEYNEYQKAGRDADMQLYTLNNMLSAIKNPNVYQGTAGGLVNTFKTALSSAGVDVAGMDDAAIINSGKSQLMGALRKDLMPGAMSDRDIGFLVNMVPGLGKTREQNEAIINMFAKVYQRQAEASKFVTDYVAEHGTWDVHGQRALMKLTNRPIFTDEERAAAMGQPVYRIMLAPNGKKVKVHLSEVDNAIKNGGKIIQ